MRPSTKIKASREKHTHIRVPIVIPSDYNEAQTLKLFGMPLPTHAEVELAPETIVKIFKVNQFMSQQVVHGASFIDKTKGGSYKNHVKFFVHDFQIPVTEYEDLEQYFKTFSGHFTITLNSCKPPKAIFTMRFIYHDGAAREFLFFTDSIEIEY